MGTALYIQGCLVAASVSIHYTPVQEADQVVWYSHVLKNCPEFVAIHTVKCFGIINKAEVDIFLEFFCFFDDPVDVGNLISGSSAFSKTSLHLEVHGSCTVEAWLGEF